MRFKGVTKQTWTRIIGLFLILINQISISFFQFQLLPFGDEQIYEGISVVLTVMASIWTAWKNNSFTLAAQNADVLMYSSKSRKARM
ncbi:MAG: SPP1 phage holin family protein [Sphaerochaetaceae bacterium]|nr:SPP1 phage holin family protein [Sphaerochaetaceae bacterium]